MPINILINICYVYLEANNTNVSFYDILDKYSNVSIYNYTCTADKEQYIHRLFLWKYLRHRPQIKILDTLYVPRSILKWKKNNIVPKLFKELSKDYDIIVDFQFDQDHITTLMFDLINSEWRRHVKQHCISY